MTYDYIETPAALDALVARLTPATQLAADTEAAGYHRYRDRICLLQLATPDRTFLIDPLAVPDVSALAPLLANPTVEKVLHDADFDLRLLWRDLRLQVRGLFDTKIAAALVGESGLGLSALLETHLGVSLPKTFQRADWAARPLPPEMCAYAVADTAHLIALRDRLHDRLVQLGRQHWAEEEFRRREMVPDAEEPSDAREAFLRIKGARDLTPQGLAILRELHAWREQVASARDLAPFRVLGHEALVALSARPPATTSALTKVRGIGGSLLRHHGTQLLEAIQRGLAVPEAERPRFPMAARWTRDRELEQLVERLKAARTRRAAELGLDPGLLMGRSTLEDIAKRRPRTLAELREVAEVREWQIEALGDALLEVIPAANPA